MLFRSVEDEKIIELFLERSEDAIAETSKKYGAYCHKIAKNILSDDLDAGECVNDTYLAAWNSIPPQIPNVFRLFLAKITRNVALDKYAYHNAKKRSLMLETTLSEFSEAVPGQFSVEKEQENKEISKVISDFLRGIEKEQRVIFVRRYFFNDSIKEIADRFKISESKTKSILFRVRKKLKSHLEMEGQII